MILQAARALCRPAVGNARLGRVVFWSAHALVGFAIRRSVLESLFCVYYVLLSDAVLPCHRPCARGMCLRGGAMPCCAALRLSIRSVPNFARQRLVPWFDVCRDDLSLLMQWLQQAWLARLFVG